MIAGIKWSTLQQPKEAAMLCQEGMTIVEVRSALLVPHNIKQVTPAKKRVMQGRLINIAQIVGW